MSRLPVMIDPGEKKVLVIGGGEIAANKVEKIESFGVEVLVISAEFSERFSTLRAERITTKITDPEQIRKYIAESAFVVIATDDPILNDSLEYCCVSNKVLFNRVDAINSPLIFPATFQMNGVTVAVSTSGKSPSFARYLRDQLEEYSKRYVTAMPVLETLRKQVSFNCFHSRSEYFRKLLDNKHFWKLVDDGKLEEACRFALNIWQHPVESSK